MNQRSGRLLKKALLALVILYVIGGLVLFFIQDLLLFHPKPVSRNYRYSFDVPFEELNLPFKYENLSIIKFKTGKTRNGLVLFYHGNMKNVEHYAKYPSIFLRNGYDVWMIDYPGFGKTTGKRSEKIIYEQALVMFDLAVQKIKPDSVVVYGKSIGTGIASYVAAKRYCRRLILETPYYSINALARHYFPIYPVVPMSSYTFPQYSNIQEIQSPVNLLHGTRDEIIPYRHAVRLKNEKPSVELITIEGGRHNDLSTFDLFQDKIDSLLAH